MRATTDFTDDIPGRLKDRSFHPHFFCGLQGRRDNFVGVGVVADNVTRLFSKESNGEKKKPTGRGHWERMAKGHEFQVQRVLFSFVTSRGYRRRRSVLSKSRHIYVSPPIQSSP